MRYIALTIFLFTTLLHNGQAGLQTPVNCGEIQTDLLAVESRIQNACISQTPEGDCCDACPDGDCTQREFNYSCMPKKDLNMLYNKKMAQLIIAQGLLSIKLGVTTNYNALRDLTTTDIDKVTSKIDKLEKSLDKAHLLSLSLFANDDKEGHAKDSMMPSGDQLTLFNRYRGSLDELPVYLDKQCRDNSFKGMEFCKEIKNYKITKPKRYKDFIVTLKGFLQADRKAVPGNMNDRIKRYKSYQQKLIISKKGKDGKLKNLTPKQFKDNHLVEIKELKEHLLEFKNNKTTPKRRKIISKSILDKSNRLEQITGSYLAHKTHHKKATDFFKQNFDQPLEMLDVPSLLLEGDFRSHFTRLGQNIGADIASQERAMLAQSKKNMSCSDKKCIKIACAPGGNGALSLCDNYNKYREQSAVQAKLNAANKCLIDNDDPKAKITCLENLNKNSKSDIARLTQELAHLDKKRKDQDESQVFQLLQFKKAMGIKALQLNSCPGVDDKVIAGVTDIDCGATAAQADPSMYKTIMLGGQEVLLALNGKLLKDTISGLSDPSQMDNITEDFMKNCEEGLFENDKLCQYYLIKDSNTRKVTKAIKTKKRIERRRRIDRQRIAQEEEDAEPSAFKKGAMAFATALGNDLPSFVNLWGQTRVMDANADATIIQSDIAKDAYIARYNAALAGGYNSSTNYTNYTNWGASQLGYSYNDLSTFNATNQSNAYRYNANPNQFSLSIPGPTTIQSFIPDQQTT